MTAENISSTQHRTLALRFPEVNIQGNAWPCPEDLLDRHKEIENLSPVLLNAQAPLVFAIDAPWGAGKTTFIKLWQCYLETQDKVSLYLNAWESDFEEDPLLPMLSAFDSWLTNQAEETASIKAWTKAKKYTPAIIKATAVAATKAATFGALDLDKELEKLAVDLTGGAIEGLVDSFNVKKAALTKFKESIEKAMEALPGSQQNLIIFIDELDRCKPTYAIEMLERIKHLFDIDRLVFVLAVNREQLSKSLQGVYGPSFDGNHYLKRFIDLDYQLRLPDQDAYVMTRLNQQDIQEYFATRRDGGSELKTLGELLSGLVQRFDYKLRDIDQLIMRLRLILRSIPRDQYLDVAVLAALLVLREKNTNLYEQYVKDVKHANEVIEYLMGMPSNVKSLPKYYGWVGGWLIRSGKDSYAKVDLDSLIKPWRKLLDTLDQGSGHYFQVNRLIEIAEDTNDHFWGRENMSNLAFNQIELVNQIDIGNT